MNPQEMLEQLTELQAQIDLIRISEREALEKVIPPDVRQAMEDVETEFGDILERVSMKYSELETAIKQAVLETGETVKGGAFQAVCNKGRVSWDSKKLEGLMMIVPQLEGARKQGEPYVTLRKVG